jgi:hypothetical protein
VEEIKLETMIRRAEGFTTARVQEDLMMLNVEQGAYYSLDSIAAEIWNLLEQPARVSEIVERLRQLYDVTAEQCRSDVLEFLGEMQENGMILLS